MPLDKNLSAADLLHLTCNLTRRFDERYAQARLAELGMLLKRKPGRLSGGQQAVVRLAPWPRENIPAAINPSGHWPEFHLLSGLTAREARVLTCRLPPHPGSGMWRAR
jgi:hypothetical protein